MMQNFPGAATLPRGFRLHDPDCTMIIPSTPEPDTHSTGEEPRAPRAPSPQRQRFRLRKRNLTLFSAPTKQFLASVEAADVPIPSIEEPEVCDAPGTTQSQYPAINNLADLHDGSSLSIPQSRGRLFTPHTPMPGHAPSLSPRRYPDWSMDSALDHESSPECDSSRPSTSRSTLTSSSAFSRASILSDGASLNEIELKAYPNMLGESLELDAPCNDVLQSDVSMDETADKAKSRKAPWTKAMNAHIWTTYMAYLQDPKVTPFDTGKNGVPPQGVCMRVSRAAKRSWKGTKSNGQANRACASTPVAFVQWPHTCAATRQQLREICRAKNMSSMMRPEQLSVPDFRNSRLMSRQCRRTTPIGSVFSARDMQVSLTVSTAESMQPHGPLAQLALSEPSSTETEEFPGIPDEEGHPVLDFFGSAPRLMSAAPISRVSTSSSTQPIFREALSFSAPISRQNSSGRKGLQSPVRLTRSRSNTQHQRRRSRQVSQVPRRIKRPSLGGDLYNEPNKLGVDFGRRRARSTSEYLARDLSSVQRPSLEELLKDAPPMPPLPAVHRDSVKEFPALAPPARLGSPFAGSLNPSFTFPTRLSQSSFCVNTEDVSRPFATVQEAPGRGSDNVQFEKNDLESKLAYIDHRLREINEHHRT
ncbi:hypothetical protein Cpir12675_003515 [Ceratocystis pirilliformis]|uniref:Uncharacterized protein n=1 Tax=Ceratocystis pirilliformis TaxID=259994 RepID=A0ABR3Z2B6_9PEZI